MPQLTNRTKIRTILEADRLWAAYAIADLEPGFFERTSWFRSVNEASALALVYSTADSAFPVPVLMTFGNVQALRWILHEIDTTLHLRELYVAVRPEILPLLAELYQLTHEKAMLRMSLDPKCYQPIVTDRVVRLGRTDFEAVQRLYADGEASGESPAWFLPEMLGQGVYYGIRENAALVAVAGTHVVATGEGVGCLGNIYTRRDRRGRGLSTQVTSAVTAHLATMPLRTIALNVRENNPAAIRVYERLGFQRYCGYVEAVALKRA
jgi:ribosomal protein S18 acetylase RimI-like enzyme